MTGTGEVTKRRLREGKGEFPVDCPLEDNAVRAHYKAFDLETGVVGLSLHKGLPQALPSRWQDKSL